MAASITSLDVSAEGGDKHMRAACFDLPGGPDKLYIKSVPIPFLKDREILVKVYASAINRADTLQRQGKYSAPAGESDVLGLEAAGVVEKVGPRCATKWKEGNRVMALLGGGGNAEYVAVNEDLLLPVPNGMTFRDAASIPETWLTAYQLLHLVGKVKEGQNVLVHAAGSGVGLAAVQLAKLASTSVYATAGTDGKLSFARQFGALHTFNYKEGVFADRVLELSKGHGMDLILDPVGGQFCDQNSTVLAVDGHWILYGTLGGVEVSGNLLGRILAKRGALQGTTLRSRPLEYKADLVKRFTDKILPLFGSGALKAVIDCEFPLGRIADAHRHMEDNKNTGKIVLVVRSERDETYVEGDDD